MGEDQPRRQDGRRPRSSQRFGVNSAKTNGTGKHGKPEKKAKKDGKAKSNELRA